MALLKGLRRHNKWILVVGGSLLMIAWLMPQGIKQLGPARKGPLVGSVDGRKVYQVDLVAHRADLAAVRALIPSIAATLVEPSRSFEDAHWMLLTREAEEAGLVGGPQDGAEWLQELAPQLVLGQMYRDTQERFPQLTPELFQQFFLPQRQDEFQKSVEQLREAFALPDGVLLRRAAGDNRMTLDQVLTAVARARGIMRMQAAYMGADARGVRSTRFSDRVAKVSAEKWGDHASADTVFLPADLAVPSVPEPTPEEIQATFEKYRDSIPGTGEFGIGYRQPPRIKLAWLKLDRAAIRDAVPIDPVSVRKEWQLRRDTYKGEFAEEKARVEAALRDRRADELVQTALQIIKAEVFKSVRSLETGPDGYRKIPNSWTRPRLEDIAGAVQTQVSDSAGLRFPLPTISVRDARWMTMSELAAERDLAGARIHFANRDWPLVQNGPGGAPPVLFQLRELGAGTPLLLQPGIPLIDFPADDPARNIYVAMVLDARAQSAPDSIDEVRDRVTADVKRMKAYEALVARAEEFRQAAIAGGASAVADLFRPVPDAPPPADPPAVTPVRYISRQYANTDPALDSETFRNAVMDAADRIDPMTAPGDYDPASATVAIPIPQHLGIAIARITAVTPLTWETYRAGIDQTLSQEARNAIGEATSKSPFAYSVVAARHGWVMDARDEEEHQKSPDSPEPEEPPPGQG